MFSANAVLGKQFLPLLLTCDADTSAEGVFFFFKDKSMKLSMWFALFLCLIC